MKTAWMIAAMLLALGLAGCGKNEDAETTKADDDPVEVAGGETDTDDNGSPGSGGETDNDDNGSGGRPDMTWTGDGSIRGTDPDTGATLEAGPAGTVSLPDGFPEDVHVYDGTIIMAYAQEQKGMFSVTLQTADTPETVLETYAKMAAADGWQKEHEMNMGPQMMRVYKKENRVLNVSVVRAEDVTTVSVTSTTTATTGD